MAVAPLSSPVSAPEAAPPESATRLTQRSDDFWPRFRRHPLALLGATLLVALFFVAFMAPYITKGDPAAIFPNGVNALGVPHPPGAGFLLGADTLGRDIWTRVAYGARLSLLVAFCAMITSVTIGTTVGLLAGYFGGWVDSALTRITEIVASLPTVLLAISLSLVLPKHLPKFFLFNLNEYLHMSRFLGIKLGPYDPDLTNFRLLLAIGLVTWTGISRAVRGQTLAIKEREFIEAGKALGLSHRVILWRHLLPNVLPTVIVMATLATANNLLLEAGLSYLTLGIKPEEPSWGGIIAEGQPYLLAAPWIVLAPGFALVIAVSAFNLLGSALNEVLEPRR